MSLTHKRKRDDTKATGNYAAIKRIYDKPAETDGLRVLIDRLWPRGVSKERTGIDLWLKEIAPSPDLRIWFSHKPERFTEFSHKYIDELSDNPAVVQLENLFANHPTITLLYAAKDPAINRVTVLRQFLAKQNHQSKVGSAPEAPTVEGWM